MTPVADDQLRADARRNRDALLAAAGAVFAEEGLDAPLYEIARRAGVGQGTLYRRFATREALIEAIADHHLAELAEVALRAGDGPEAFFLFFGGAARLQREDRGLIDALAARPLPEHVVRARREAFAGIVEPPLRRSQAAGLARPDLGADDVWLLLRMAGAAARGADESAERALELLLPAMRLGG
jgi:AcrR family transcriptional regulator